jgi:hypothetical protein
VKHRSALYRVQAILDALFTPRPRVWSSALTFLAAALILSAVVPGMSFRGGTFAYGFTAVVDPDGIAVDSVRAGPGQELWNVDVRWTRNERNGTISSAVQTTVARKGADGAALAAPTAPDVARVVRAWATQKGIDPLLLRTVEAGGNVVDRSWWGVFVPAGQWLIRVLFLAGLVLGLGRLSVRRYFERSIAAWNEGKCPQCGYAMEGTTSGRCPECGCVGAEHVAMLEEMMARRPAARTAAG